MLKVLSWIIPEFLKQPAAQSVELGEDWCWREKIPVPEGMMNLQDVVETLEAGPYAFSADPRFTYNGRIFRDIRDWAVDGLLTVKGHAATHHEGGLKRQMDLVDIPPGHWIKNEICWLTYWTMLQSITKIEGAHLDTVESLPNGRADYWDPLKFADGQYTGLRFDRAEVDATLGQGPRKK